MLVPRGVASRGCFKKSFAVAFWLLFLAVVFSRLRAGTQLGCTRGGSAPSAQSASSARLFYSLRNEHRLERLLLEHQERARAAVQHSATAATRPRAGPPSAARVALVAPGLRPRRDR